VESGSVEVQKLILMQKDFHINKDLQKEYQIFLENENKKNKTCIKYEMNPIILAQGYWPFTITEEEAIIIPKELQESIKIFEKFYNEKHQNRSLKWIFAQGSCNITSNSFDKKYLFIVSNYQLLVFLLFNRVLKRYSLNEIHYLTQIPLDELDSCLVPLIKLGILQLLNENEAKINHTKVFFYKKLKYLKFFYMIQ